MVVRGVTGHARATPDRPALVLGDRVVTFGELDRRARRLAHVLLRAGAGPGAPAAAILPNGIEYFETATATTMAATPFLPVNWHLKADELRYILEDSAAAAVVVDASLGAEIVSAVRALGAREVLVVGDGYEEALDAAPGSDGLEASTGPSYIFYTSGTTSRPKGVVHSLMAPPSERQARQAQARMVQEAQVALWWWEPRDVYVMTGPAYHAAHGGWSGTALFVGAETVIMPAWDAREWMRLVELHRGTRSFMVPAHFIRVLEIPEEERRSYDLSSLELVVHAAAPCPIPVKRRMIEAFPQAEIHELYGASEGGATRIGPAEWLDHPGSVGRPWPGVEITILDEGGSPLPAGEPGLIHIRPAAGRFHYRNDPERTAEAWQGDSFTVGDIGHLDDDGYLYITDRQSDMVLWGGVNIAPREIEDVLYAHPQVVDCAVFGVPDERDGERVKAMVETRGGVTPEALSDWVRDHLADYKVPRTWEIVDSLPRDPNGKVLKRRLRAAHWAP